MKIMTDCYLKTSTDLLAEAVTINITGQPLSLSLRSAISFFQSGIAIKHCNYILKHYI